VVLGAEESCVRDVGGSVVGEPDVVMGVGLPPVRRTPSQWSSGHGEVFA
jgi:hypothetical protein